MAFTKAGRYFDSIQIKTSLVGVSLSAPAANTAVNVYNNGTLTLASLWVDDAMTVAADNPVLTDQYGNLGFRAAPGLYDLAANGVDLRGVVVSPHKDEASIRSATAVAADYTTLLTDAGKEIEANSTSPIAITIPANASVPYPVGTLLPVTRLGIGAVSLVAPAGVTISGSLLVPARYGTLLLRQRAANVWVSTVLAPRQFFDVETYGGIADDSTDVTAALVLAVAAAAPVFGVVRATGLFALAGRAVIPQGVDLQGAGDGDTHAGTVFRCTAAGAGISYGTRTTGGRGGISSGWQVDGANIATNPLFIGLTVQRTFANVEAKRANGTAWVLEGTQNCVFIGTNAANSVLGVSIDYGAAGNLFLRPEWDTNGFDLEIRQTSAINGNTHNNRFDHPIFERTTGAGHVRQYQADWTLFNSPIFQAAGGAAFESVRCDNGIIDLQSPNTTGNAVGSGGFAYVVAGGTILLGGSSVVNSMHVAYRVTSGVIRRGPNCREISTTTFVDGALGAAGLISERLAGYQVDASNAFGRGASGGTGLGDKMALYADQYGLGLQAGRVVAYVPDTTAGLAVRLLSASGALSSGSDATSMGGDGDFESYPVARGLIAKSPNGARWRLTITNAGAVLVSAL